jgi:hypothetical protein
MLQPLLSLFYAKRAAVVPAEEDLVVAAAALLLLLQQGFLIMASQHTLPLLLLNISLLLMSTPINTNPLHSDTKPYHIVLLPKGIPRKTSPSIIMCVNK